MAEAIHNFTYNTIIITYQMDLKQKNPTSILKKVSANIENGRKNIQSDVNLTQNLHSVKGNFGEVQYLIKNQVSSIQAMKNFTKQNNGSSKNLQVKRFFLNYIQKAKIEFRSLFEVIKENFMVSMKNKNNDNWQKVEKEFQKAINNLKDQSETSEKMYTAVNKINVVKDSLLVQFFKLMLYKKNILWRDLNAPYDDYIHGEIKSSINLIKLNQEKYGYIPHTLEFMMPKFQLQFVEFNIHDLIRIILIDHNELIQGLKNYSKLSDQPQVMEDISKNQHIVKGLRQRIQLLSQNYDSLLQKYRTLQISKGKTISGPNQEKSLSEKIQEMENNLIKKQQEIIELRQISLKQDSLMANLKQKNKELEDELSKWNKYQIPKIKQLQGNQKSILEQFNKVRRDLQTYSNMVQHEREEKIKTLQDLNVQKHRVHQLANILGRQRRHIKELKNQIIRQQKIVMELLDKIPDK